MAPNTKEVVYFIASGFAARGEGGALLTSVVKVSPA